MKDYYLIKEVNGIPFILGQFDTEDEAIKAFPTGSKGQYGIAHLTKELGASKAIISSLNKEIKELKKEVELIKKKELW